MIMVMLKNEDKVDSMQALIKLTIIQRVGVDVSIMWRIKLDLRLFDPKEPLWAFAKETTLPIAVAVPSLKISCTSPYCVC